MILKIMRRLFRWFGWPDRSRKVDIELIARSGLLDLAWYREQLGGEAVPSSLDEAAAHYLQIGWRQGYSPGAGFDTKWYLSQYPDVAASGLNPLVHYLRHGRDEGRFPRPNRALVWEHYLWAGLDELMLLRLQSLLEADDATEEEKGQARWALARWYAWQGDWAQVVELLVLNRGLAPAMPKHVGPVLLAVDALRRTAAVRQALALVDTWLERWPNHPDLCLARANLLADHDTDVATMEQRLAWINRPLLAHGLAPILPRDAGRPLSLDNLRGADVVANGDGPLVSVIMPVWNAEQTVATALRSLFAQSWRNLEILVVDDASTDDSWLALQSLAEECPDDMSLRLIRHEVNQGAYAARNTALAEARGELLTCHDADDWSHPEKLARQVAALQANPKWKASVSHWSRATPDLIFHRWRVEEGWIYRNVSSLMFRRSVFEALGYWDRVSVNADTEYYYRIQAAFGEQAIGEVLPGVPLSFGRADKGSLSQHSATHLVTQFVGLRKDYMDAARRWHQRVAVNRDYCLPARPSYRPFYAPEAMCRDRLPLRDTEPLDLIQQSGLFDPIWYSYRYPDLLDTVIDPLTHYFLHGAREGRDPGPDFSTSGYRYAQGLDEQVDPLLHYVKKGGGEPLPLFEGARAPRPDAPSVLLCAHLAGPMLFGAERSLVDVLQALDALGLNVVVTLPSVGNTDYLATLRRYARAVAVLPYGWWLAGRPDFEATTRHFENLLRRFEIDVLHVNTLVLHEPLLAARRLGVPVVVHVRELPEHDPALCQLLGAEADEVGEHVLRLADRVIANSQCVARFLAKLQVAGAAPVPVDVVPNSLEMKDLLALAPVSRTGRKPGALTVGMLSSNLPKKGLADFEKMAAALARRAPQVKCLLFGPRNAHIDALLARQKAGGAPANLYYAGYVENPAEALARLDVLVSLSHFQESFGRTVLEAMAAARPVICYDWGALPELVVDEQTGYVVPFRDVDAVVDHLIALAAAPERRQAMGLAGRERALNEFAPEVFRRRLSGVYAALLGQRSSDAASSFIVE